jgi:hypothetical protein
MQAFRLVLIGVLLVTLTTATVVFACSSDKLIWMPEGASADLLYRFVRGEKAGYIDQTGKIVISPTLSFFGNSGDEFHDGLLEVGASDGVYVGRDGKRAIKPEFFRGWDFSEGLAVAIPKGGDKFGYIDTSGKFVISPRFPGYPDGYVYSFHEGLAMIKAGYKIGYIDRTGEFTIRPQFLWGTDFRDGMAAVVAEGPCLYREHDSPCPDSGLAGQVASAEHLLNLLSCKYTFIDKQGRIVSGERYEVVRDFSEGTAPVRVDQLWGFIDKAGKMVISPKFEDAAPFKDGFARVRSGGSFGYIDRSGAISIPVQFRDADSFSEGLAVVGDRDRREFHYIDKNGRAVMNGKSFREASHFRGGLAHVHLPNGAFAYIDQSGKEVFTYRR